MAAHTQTPQAGNGRAARNSFTHKEEPTTDDQGSNVVASASLCLCTWLIIGGVAYGPEFNDSFLGWLVLAICLMIQSYGTLMTLVFIENSGHNRGKMMFAAGAFGFSITLVLFLVFGRSADERMIFWSLAGMYLGWLLEMFMGVFASLASRIDRAKISR